MIIVLLDANVIVSAFLNQLTPPGRLFALWQAGWFTLVISEQIFAEVERALLVPYFRRRLTPAEVHDNLDLLRLRATLVTITVAVHGVATHPEDDLALATAVSASADYLVTGDRGLLALGSYRGVAIVSPRDFLDVLETAPEP